jgi:hypothetical protein
VWTELSAWGKPAIAGLLLLCALGGLSGWAARRFGKRELTGTPQDRSERLKDRVLFAAAIISGAIVYGSLVIGSFENLTTWAGDTLDWKNWQQYLVPISLDGLGTAAGVLAFRAVKKRLSPYACYAMVWGATATSVTINATEGGKHGGPAAIYMGFLSVAVMAMFHLFLGQFQAGAEHQGRKYPRFGARWLTKGWGKDATILLFIDWVNSPPVDIEPTVANAILHRGRVLDARATATRTLVRKARDEKAAEHIHAADLQRLVRDAENADTIAELQAAANDALAKVAEESARRVGAEDDARLRGEEAERLRAALAEVSAKPARKPAQVSARSVGAEPAREDPAQVSAEERDRNDRAKVALIRETYAKHRKLTGDPLTRYKVETFKPDGEKSWDVKSRQAERILAILDAEFAGANSEDREDLSA